jgi:hypothetical protein
VELCEEDVIMEEIMVSLIWLDAKSMHSLMGVFIYENLSVVSRASELNKVLMLSCLGNRGYLRFVTRSNIQEESSQTT